MREPQSCKFGTIQVSTHGLTKVNGGKYAVAIMVDFDLTKDHYDAIKATLQAYTAFRLANPQRRGFLLVFHESYTDRAECAQQVTSFLLKVTERLDKPVKDKPRAPAWNSPYNNAATRAARNLEMPNDIYSRRAARK